MTNRRLENESFSRNTARGMTKSIINNRHTAARMMNEDNYPIVNSVREEEPAALSKYVLM